MAGEPRRTGQLGGHRIRDQRAGRRGRTAARAAGPRAGRGAADRLRADEVGPRAGRRRATADRQGPHHRRDLGAGHPADPDGRHPRARAQGLDLAGHPPVAIAGHSQGVTAVRVAEGRGHRRRRAAGDGAADRRGRLAGVPPPRHGRPGRQVADGVGDQRRPRPDRRAARRLRHRTSAPCWRPRCRSATAGAPSSSPAPPNSWPGSSCTATKITEKEEAERKNKLRGGAVFRPVFNRVQVEVGFHTPRLADGVDCRRRVGRRSRHRRRAGARDGRDDLRRRPSTGSPRSRGCTTAGAKLDHRPGPQRHRDAPDRAGDPRPGHRHRPRRHPRRPAQPVHRRRGARDRAGRGRATRRRW